MGFLERKEREKEQRKRLILNAGEKLFLAQGLKNTTMEQISNECELSRATVYFYFKNKYEIFYTILLRAADLLYGKMKEKSEAEANAELKLRAIGDAYLEFFREEPSYYKFVNFMEDHSDEELREQNSPAQEVFEKSNRIWVLIVGIIEDCINKGYYRKDINPFEIAILLWSASSGVMQVLGHIEKSKEIENLKLSDDIVCKNHIHFFGELKLESMLSKLWASILSTIRNKTLESS